MTNTTPAAKAPTVRPPLERGDDGSANRYPVRFQTCCCRQHAGANTCPDCPDHGYDRCQATGVHVCSPDNSCDGA